MGFVQGEPFLRLFVSVVMKLMIDTARAEGMQEIALDVFGELAGVNGDGGGGHKLLMFCRTVQHQMQTKGSAPQHNLNHNPHLRFEITIKIKNLLPQKSGWSSSRVQIRFCQGRLAEETSDGSASRPYPRCRLRSQNLICATRS